MPTRRQTLTAGALLAGATGLPAYANTPARMLPSTAEPTRTVTVNLSDAADLYHCAYADQTWRAKCAELSLYEGETIRLAFTNTTQDPALIDAATLGNLRLAPGQSAAFTFDAQAAGRIDLAIASGQSTQSRRLLIHPSDAPHDMLA